MNGAVSIKNLVASHKEKETMTACKNYSAQIESKSSNKNIKTDIPTRHTRDCLAKLGGPQYYIRELGQQPRYAKLPGESFGMSLPLQVTEMNAQHLYHPGRRSLVLSTTLPVTSTVSGTQR